MVEGMRDVVTDPLGHHYGDHDGKQEGDVVGYFDLEKQWCLI